MLKSNQKIPEGWSVKKISDLGTTISGGTPNTNNPEYWDGDVLWVTPSEVSALSSRFIWDTERKITEKGLKQSSAKLLPVNSLIVCTRATIGDCCINKNPMCTNQGFKNIITKNNNVDFLYYLITKNKNTLVRKACGSTFLEISKKDIDNLKFVIPPLPEQEKIAEILGTWDKAIEKLSHLIEQKKLLKKGLMQRLLTGKVRLFKTSPLAGEVADLSAGEGLDNNDNIKISSHRIYQPYIKEFSRDMRKNSTKAENLLWQKIRNGQLGFKFRRQHQVDNKYIADFACLEKRLIIELDGGQHNGSPTDKDRTLYLEENNFRVIRFWDNEILQNIDGCLAKILAECSLETPHQAQECRPLPQGARNEEECSMNTPHQAQKCHPLPQGARKNERFSQPWKTVKLGNFCKTFSGGTPSVKNASFYDGNIPFIRSGEIHLTSTALFISESGLTNSAAKLVEKGDILFALYGATSGEVDISKINGAINQAILCIKPLSLNKYFLKDILEYQKQNILNKYLQGGQGNLSAEIIKSLNIYIPSDLSEQQAIADVLTKADEEIDLLNKKLTLFKEQKKGLMQQLLTGNIRVKVN